MHDEAYLPSPDVVIVVRMLVEEKACPQPESEDEVVTGTELHQLDRVNRVIILTRPETTMPVDEVVSEAVVVRKTHRAELSLPAVLQIPERDTRVTWQE